LWPWLPIAIVLHSRLLLATMCQFISPNVFRSDLTSSLYLFQAFFPCNFNSFNIVFRNSLVIRPFIMSILTECDQLYKCYNVCLM
jgi:hypothetical protein